MIRVTFADTASRDAFADRFKLTTKVDALDLDIGWHLLQFAKLDPTATDYHQVAVLEAGMGAATIQEFVIKGDPIHFGQWATIIADLGNGFYHVSSVDATNLADNVDSIEHTSAPMKLMANVGSIESMNGESTSLDPTGSDAQWPRIRIVSRYRPLAESFSTHDMTYLSKPELYVFDTGINFSHPEFDYPGFEGVNFWTCFGPPGGPYDYYDDNIGHGTAVTSMAVGKNLGIANNCKVFNVKIGDATGTASILQIGQAIDALVAVASADPLKTRICNMSWGTARSAYLDAKVQGLLDLGITVICAAGNDGIDIADISPAGMVDVLTVAAMDKYDIPCGFNNISPSDAGVTTGHGQELDLFAPGEAVVVANYTGGYLMISGTSFSAPLVAGVAAEIGALFADMVPFAQMKNTIITTATENALLFEDSTFSENQNKIVYLITSDPNASYKNNNMTMYLGVHPESGEPIVANLNSAINVSDLNVVFPDDPVVWSIEWLDSAMEADYAQFMNLEPETGTLTIANPTVTLPEETKLKMIEFVAVATTSRARMTGTTMFYFQTNPLYAETKESDITLALTETNSISFYAAWSASIK
jgi:hypothetical protein